jgi:hypothetical protein
MSFLRLAATVVVPVPHGNFGFETKRAAMGRVTAVASVV